MPCKFLIQVSCCLLLVFTSCSQKDYKEPKIDLSSYVIQDGFYLESIASEPFIEAPVAMTFDNEGRIWVVEMKGYMQTLEGLSEDLPNGTISILEDLDNDGVVDNSKVFLENLVLPRAIAQVYDGLLYAEPPNLWFVEIENDLPKNKVLVDSLYADGGNVEHQPNGLMLHIDNWIYNAKSNYRYQRKNGKWLKEPTTFRGQWGITKDNFGRLYYNNNSTQIMGDYVLPNTLINNPFFSPKVGIDNVLTNNQRVYPLHATSVNRGYMDGILDKDSILVNVTAACGPLVYRGSDFPQDYYQNAFVCVPEANLIKRNFLEFYADSIEAKQTWNDREFLASTDEGFRPVNIYNGPDGAMYIVDMHRGIIQDKAYLTPYLKQHMANKQLDTLMGMGRILKVFKNSNSPLEQLNLSTLEVQKLVEMLESKNGWTRDRAQHLLIIKNDKSVVQKIKEIAEMSKFDVAKIHALHTLNGMEELDFQFLINILKTELNSEVLAHALGLIEQFSSKQNVNELYSVLPKLLERNNLEVDLYLLLSLNKWIEVDKVKLFPIVQELSNKYKTKPIYQEAVINSLRGFEKEYIQMSNNINPTLKSFLVTTTKNRESNTKNFIYTNSGTPTDNRTKGYNMYRTICAACHGMGGNGINGVAPPLVNSEYVKESPERLALILLHGLKGPIHVNGELYELNGTMPGLSSNTEISDQDIADIISYLHNAFSVTGKNIEADQIKNLRANPPKDGLFTEQELKDLGY